MTAQANIISSLLLVILLTLNLCSISPLRSVHQWLQTNLKQLLLHVKQVTRDVYVLEHRFELIINLDLRFEVVRDLGYIY